MLGWNHMSILSNKHLALESFLPAFLYTNTESGWLQISGTQIGSYFSGMNKKKKKSKKHLQYINYFYILPIRSPLGILFDHFSWWGSAWIFIKIVISWPWPGVCDICKNFSNVLSIAYTNDSRVMWQKRSFLAPTKLLAFNMFSCSQCASWIWKVSFFLGGQVVTHASLRVVTRRTKTTSSSASWCETSGGSSRRICGESLTWSNFWGDMKWWSK